MMLGLFLCCVSLAALSQQVRHGDLDSDDDGLSDAFESALLQKFQPQFEISKGDYAREPARFAPETEHTDV